MFEARVGVPNYPALEGRVLAFWQARDIFGALRAQTASGKPWKGWTGRLPPLTAWARFIIKRRSDKVAFDRFHAMQGHRLRWQNGFDCSGLPTETEVAVTRLFTLQPIFSTSAWTRFRAQGARVEVFARTIAAQSNRLEMGAA